MTRSAWSAISRCLETHHWTKHRRQEGLTVARRHAPLPLALVVVEGDLRGALSPARQPLIQEADRRAILVRGQDLEASQSVPAPCPIANRLQSARGLVIRVTATA